MTPMLDMAFQLLAFFILTFKAPSAETHIDLYLPATPAALPSGPRGQARPSPSRAIDADLENDLLVRAEADDLGDLKALRLGEANLPDLPALGSRLRRYTQLLGDRPLRVRLVADDRLRYEPAARIIATCSAAGITSVRLAQPGAIPALRGLPPGPGAGGGAAMRRGLVTGWSWLAVLLLAHGGWSGRAQSGSDDLETRLGLADLAAYRAALSGKATADDAHASGPMRPVTFHDLWDHPETWRGRRVQVRGRSPGSSAKTQSAACLRWRGPG